MIQCPTVSGRKPRSDVVNTLEGEVRERGRGGGRVKGGGKEIKEERKEVGEGTRRERSHTFLTLSFQLPAVSAIIFPLHVAVKKSGTN